MRATLTLKGYRCFLAPAVVEIGRGFTAFVGMNNAGKSTLMRFLFECREIFSHIKQSNAVFQASFHTPQPFRPKLTTDDDEIFSNVKTGGFEFAINFDYSGDSISNDLPTQLKITVDRDLRWKSQLQTIGGELDVNPSREVTWEAAAITSAASGLLANLANVYTVCDHLTNTLYVGSFRNAVNAACNDNYLDIEVGAPFIERFRALKSGRSKKSSKEIDNLIADIKAIFGFQELDIDASADGASLHFTIDGHHYKQHEIGSGLLQFVIVLVSLAARRPRYLLVDEPETGLHPSLQLDFITTLGSYVQEGVWFSSHSIGLARSSTQRIYAVHAKKPGDSIIQPLEGHPTLAEFLGEMSFSSHKELGFEKILLVEGATDVTAMQQFLRKKGMDHKIVALSLSGRINGNMAIDLDEVLRISTNVSAVIDSERATPGAPLEQSRIDFQNLCRIKHIACHVLDRRATENYFPDHVVKSLFGSSHQALGPFQKLEHLPIRWRKEDNWRLARAMSDAEIDATDLGQFLNTLR